MFLKRELSIVGTFPTKGARLKEFLDAVTVWINKPHVANRRLSGTRILQITTAESIDSIERVLNNISCAHDINPPNDEIHTISLEADLKENDEKFIIIIRQLFPKQRKVFPVLLEAIVFDSSSHTVTFYPLSHSSQSAESKDADVSSEVTYQFAYLSSDDQNSSLQLSCSVTKEKTALPSSHAQATPSWLTDTLAPKIARWMEQCNLSTAIKSLRLVGVDRYYKTYTALKEKYGTELVKNWTETTDPQKFVYEDIGIATYLLLIWEEDRKKTGSSRKQSFVDLGCGNGLLVYILSKEGHPGLGIDLRKRKIWEMFGADVRLEEKSITPSADNLFPEFDWIIGNHSDELTPWIPVIAARSSYTCSYFVLPCCLHDFNCRFNSKVKGESNYRSYLTYVAEVGHTCGFNVEEDTLRIPSTKRVCQIGRHRTYPADQESSADQLRQAFINKRCAVTSASQPSSENPQSAQTDTHNSPSSPNLKREHDDVTKQESDRVSEDVRDCGDEASRNGENSGAWTEHFQARSSQERVRNCQRVSQGTKERVVQAVFRAVLDAEDTTETQGHDGKRWRKGGSIALGTVAGMLDAGTREELKSECGGIQTLLRNHSNIFQVSGGKVQLRDFSVDNPWSPFGRNKSRKTDPALLKTSLCWFHGNHPDGCPRSAAGCSFAHGEGELRPRETPAKK